MACYGFDKLILFARLAFQAMLSLMRIASLQFAFASLAPFVFCLIAVLIIPFLPLAACTDLAITLQDGSQINGRSMEFGLPMKSKISSYPKGMKWQSKAPNNQPGLAWTSRYGYIAIDCLDQGFTTDGMNEQGLSAGALWFPGAQYPQPAAPMKNRTLVLQDVGPWILGNFATVEEVKAGLSKIAIWAEPVDPIGIPPLHLAIHDAKGNHLVIEFINGQMQVFDNPNGVLTNAPELPWHLTNLRNYINLSPVNVSPMTINGILLQPTGQGTGLMGLPGDWTPPSRFIRTSLLKSFAITAKTAPEGVNLLEHILNTADIPLGAVRQPGQDGHLELTQWVVFKDLTHKILYYRTYEDLTLRSIDLKKLDFSAGQKPVSFPMTSTPEPIDMSSKLLLH